MQRMPQSPLESRRSRSFSLLVQASLLAMAALMAIPLTACGDDDSPALSDEERQAGFVSLFNGKDFTGWRFTGDTSADQATNWEVADGVIRLSGGSRPHLASAEQYGDFEMKFQWRGLRERYNSGFYIRSGKNLGSNQLNLAKGAEGALVGGKIEGSRGVGDLQKPSGEWNEWRVLVQGDRVTFWCNDQLAWEGSGLKPERGYVGFQAEGAPLEFRNIRLRKIEE